MKYFYCLIIVFLMVSFAQSQIEYLVSFDNAVHHEATIDVTYKNIPSDILELRMSRSSPGRYALHEFAKNVYSVTAVDGNGKQLPIERPNPHQWNVKNHDGTVKVSYTLFADVADGTYSGIDRSHAHLLMPATFMWARGMDEKAIRITFNIPDGSKWNIATQLFPAKESNVFTAPNLQYFMDSPTELSPFTLREWSVASADSSYKIRLAVHHDGKEQLVDIFSDMAKAIVEEEKAVFGELPKYDTGTYTFIADYLPYISGDGMEHRNSTTISSTLPLKTHALDHLGTLAHEFFHCWNIERIRPKSLEPFNFEEANMSGELWFGEGVTNYYDNLVMHRAQITSIDRFARSISGTVNAVMNSPGRKFFSAAEMSIQAPFVDGVSFRDQQNKDNTFISYYTYGAAIGLALDLTLREKFSGVTLDSYMRKVWEIHGKTERPYTNADLRNILGFITNDQKFADSFFNNFVEGHDIPDYDKLLAQAGFLIRKANEKKSWLGNAFIRYDDGKAVISAPTLINTPWYTSGLDRKDRIFKIDGTPLTSSKDLDSIIARHKPGDSVPIEFEQRGTTRTATITFEEDPRIEVVAYEQAQFPVTDTIQQFRNSWLGKRATASLPSLTKICPTCKRRYPFQNEFCQFDGAGLGLTAD